MKKLIKSICIMLSLLLVSATAISCGGKKVEDFDNSSTLLITIYDGGYGTSWASTAAEAFNAAHSDSKYEIKIKPEKLDTPTMIKYIESGMNINRGECAYFIGLGDPTPGIRKGLFADLTDVLLMKPDGNNVTIKDKVLNFDAWKAVVSGENGNGCYALPYADSTMGFIFNYDRFVEKGYLKFADANSAEVKAELTAQGIEYEIENNRIYFKSYSGDYLFFNYEEGDVITDCGRDGIYGSYDDGQPDTIEEWNTMVDTIYYDNVNPFIFSGTYSYSYSVSAFESIFADIAGVENFETFYTMDSKGKEVELIDGRKVVITPDNGYEVYKIKGISEALEFLYKYMNVDTAREKNYLHPVAYLESGYSHKQTQSSYLYAQATGGTETNPESAILYDGSWWENEASPQFDTLAKSGYPEYSFGSQDFRPLLYPKYEGSSSEKSVLATYGACGMYVPYKIHNDPTENTARISFVKEFIAYVLSNDVLKAFTLETGNIQPYAYTIDESEFKNMSKYALSNWAMYSDSKNIEIIRPQIFELNRPKKVKAENFYSFYLVLDSYTGSGEGQFLNMINLLQSDYPNGSFIPVVIDKMYTYAQASWDKYRN